MNSKLREILVIILYVLMGIGALGLVVGSISQVVYQLIEYGMYKKFLVLNHWSTWLTFGSGGLLVISYCGAGVLGGI